MGTTAEDWRVGPWTDYQASTSSEGKPHVCFIAGLLSEGSQRSQSGDPTVQKWIQCASSDPTSVPPVSSFVARYVKPHSRKDRCVFLLPSTVIVVDYSNRQIKKVHSHSIGPNSTFTGTSDVGVRIKLEGEDLGEFQFLSSEAKVSLVTVAEQITAMHVSMKQFSAEFPVFRSIDFDVSEQAGLSQVDAKILSSSKIEYSPLKLAQCLANDEYGLAALSEVLLTMVNNGGSNKYSDQCIAERSRSLFTTVSGIVSLLDIGRVSDTPTFEYLDQPGFLQLARSLYLCAFSDLQTLCKKPKFSDPELDNLARVVGRALNEILVSVGNGTDKLVPVGDAALVDSYSTLEADNKEAGKTKRRSQKTFTEEDLTNLRGKLPSIAHVPEVHWGFHSFHDLSVMDRFTALRVLDLSYNKLRSLSAAALNKFVHLERLNVRGNAIESVSGTLTLKKLVDVDVSFNNASVDDFLTLFGAKSSIRNLVLYQGSSQKIDTTDQVELSFAYRYKVLFRLGQHLAKLDDIEVGAGEHIFANWLYSERIHCGRHIFTYGLSPETSVALRQLKCLKKELGIPSQHQILVLKGAVRLALRWMLVSKSAKVTSEAVECLVLALQPGIPSRDNVGTTLFLKYGGPRIVFEVLSRCLDSGKQASAQAKSLDIIGSCVHILWWVIYGSKGDVFARGSNDLAMLSGKTHSLDSYCNLLARSLGAFASHAGDVHAWTCVSTTQIAHILLDALAGDEGDTSCSKETRILISQSVLPACSLFVSQQWINIRYVFRLLCVCIVHFYREEDADTMRTLVAAGAADVIAAIVKSDPWWAYGDDAVTDRVRLCALETGNLLTSMDGVILPEASITKLSSAVHHAVREFHACTVGSQIVGSCVKWLGLAAKMHSTRESGQPAENGGPCATVWGAGSSVSSVLLLSDFIATNWDTSASTAHDEANESQNAEQHQWMDVLRVVSQHTGDAVAAESDEMLGWRLFGVWRLWQLHCRDGLDDVTVGLQEHGADNIRTSALWTLSIRSLRVVRSCHEDGNPELYWNLAVAVLDSLFQFMVATLNMSSAHVVDHFSGALQHYQLSRIAPAHTMVAGGEMPQSPWIYALVTPASESDVDLLTAICDLLALCRVEIKERRVVLAHGLKISWLATMVQVVNGELSEWISSLSSLACVKDVVFDACRSCLPELSGILSDEQRLELLFPVLCSLQSNGIDGEGRGQLQSEMSAVVRGAVAGTSAPRTAAAVCRLCLAMYVDSGLSTDDTVRNTMVEDTKTLLTWDALRSSQTDDRWIREARLCLLNLLHTVVTVHKCEPIDLCTEETNPGLSCILPGLWDCADIDSVLSKVADFVSTAPSLMQSLVALVGIADVHDLCNRGVQLGTTGGLVASGILMKSIQERRELSELFELVSCLETGAGLFEPEHLLNVLLHVDLAVAGDVTAVNGDDVDMIAYGYHLVGITSAWRSGESTSPAAWVAFSHSLPYLYGILPSDSESLDDLVDAWCSEVGPVHSACLESAGGDQCIGAGALALLSRTFYHRALQDRCARVTKRLFDALIAMLMPNIRLWNSGEEGVTIWDRAVTRIVQHEHFGSISATSDLTSIFTESLVASLDEHTAKALQDAFAEAGDPLAYWKSPSALVDAMPKAVGEAAEKSLSLSVLLLLGQLCAYCRRDEFVDSAASLVQQVESFVRALSPHMTSGEPVSSQRTVLVLFAVTVCDVMESTRMYGAFGPETIPAVCKWLVEFVGFAVATLKHVGGDDCPVDYSSVLRVSSLQVISSCARLLPLCMRTWTSGEVDPEGEVKPGDLVCELADLVCAISSTDAQTACGMLDCIHSMLKRLSPDAMDEIVARLLKSLEGTLSTTRNVETVTRIVSILTLAVSTCGDKVWSEFHILGNDRIGALLMEQDVLRSVQSAAVEALSACQWEVSTPREETLSAIRSALESLSDDRYSSLLEALSLFLQSVMRGSKILSVTFGIWLAPLSKMAKAGKCSDILGSPHVAVLLRALGDMFQVSATEEESEHGVLSRSCVLALLRVSNQIYAKVDVPSLSDTDVGILGCFTALLATVVGRTDPDDTILKQGLVGTTQLMHSCASVDTASHSAAFESLVLSTFSLLDLYTKQAQQTGRSVLIAPSLMCKDSSALSSLHALSQSMPALLPAICDFVSSVAGDCCESPAHVEAIVDALKSMPLGSSLSLLMAAPASASETEESSSELQVTDGTCHVYYWRMAARFASLPAGEAVASGLWDVVMSVLATVQVPERDEKTWHEITTYVLVVLWRGLVSRCRVDSPVDIARPLLVVATCLYMERRSGTLPMLIDTISLLVNIMKDTNRLNDPGVSSLLLSLIVADRVGSSAPVKDETDRIAMLMETAMKDRPSSPVAELMSSICVGTMAGVDGVSWHGAFREWLQRMESDLREESLGPEEVRTAMFVLHEFAEHAEKELVHRLVNGLFAALRRFLEGDSFESEMGASLLQEAVKLCTVYCTPQGCTSLDWQGLLSLLHAMAACIPKVDYPQAVSYAESLCSLIETVIAHVDAASNAGHVWDTLLTVSLGDWVTSHSYSVWRVVCDRFINTSNVITQRLVGISMNEFRDATVLPFFLAGDLDMVPMSDGREALHARVGGRSVIERPDDVKVSVLIGDPSPSTATVQANLKLIAGILYASSFSPTVCSALWEHWNLYLDVVQSISTATELDLPLLRASAVISSACLSVVHEIQSDSDDQAADDVICQKLSSTCRVWSTVFASAIFDTSAPAWRSCGRVLTAFAGTLFGVLDGESGRRSALVPLVPYAQTLYEELAMCLVRSFNSGDIAADSPEWAHTMSLAWWLLGQPLGSIASTTVSVLAVTLGKSQKLYDVLALLVPVMEGHISGSGNGVDDIHRNVVRVTSVAMKSVPFAGSGVLDMQVYGDVLTSLLRLCVCSEAQSDPRCSMALSTSVHGLSELLSQSEVEVEALRAMDFVSLLAPLFSHADAAVVEKSLECFQCLMTRTQDTDAAETGTSTSISAGVLKSVVDRAMEHVQSGGSVKMGIAILGFLISKFPELSASCISPQTLVVLAEGMIREGLPRESHITKGLHVMAGALSATPSSLKNAKLRALLPRLVRTPLILQDVADAESEAPVKAVEDYLCAVLGIHTACKDLFISDADSARDVFLAAVLLAVRAAQAAAGLGDTSWTSIISDTLGICWRYVDGQSSATGTDWLNVAWSQLRSISASVWATLIGSVWSPGTGGPANVDAEQFLFALSTASAVASSQGRLVQAPIYGCLEILSGIAKAPEREVSEIPANLVQVTINMLAQCPMRLLPQSSRAVERVQWLVPEKVVAASSTRLRGLLWVLKTRICTSHLHRTVLPPTTGDSLDALDAECVASVSQMVCDVLDELTDADMESVVGDNVVVREVWNRRMVDGDPAIPVDFGSLLNVAVEVVQCICDALTRPSGSSVLVSRAAMVLMYAPPVRTGSGTESSVLATIVRCLNALPRTSPLFERLLDVTCSVVSGIFRGVDVPATLTNTVLRSGVLDLALRVLLDARDTGAVTPRSVSVLTVVCQMLRYNDTASHIASLWKPSPDSERSLDTSHLVGLLQKISSGSGASVDVRSARQLLVEIVAGVCSRKSFESVFAGEDKHAIALLKYITVNCLSACSTLQEALHCTRVLAYILRGLDDVDTAGMQHGIHAAVDAFVQQCGLDHCNSLVVRFCVRDTAVGTLTERGLELCDGTDVQSTVDATSYVVGIVSRRDVTGNVVRLMAAGGYVPFSVALAFSQHSLGTEYLAPLWAAIIADEALLVALQRYNLPRPLLQQMSRDAGQLGAVVSTMYKFYVHVRGTDLQRTAWKQFLGCNGVLEVLKVIRDIRSLETQHMCVQLLQMAAEDCERAGMRWTSTFDASHVMPIVKFCEQSSGGVSFDALTVLRYLCMSSDDVIRIFQQERVVDRLWRALIENPSCGSDQYTLAMRAILRIGMHVQGTDAKLDVDKALGHLASHAMVSTGDNRVEKAATIHAATAPVASWNSSIASSGPGSRMSVTLDPQAMEEMRGAFMAETKALKDQLTTLSQDSPVKNGARESAAEREQLEQRVRSAEARNADLVEEMNRLRGIVDNVTVYDQAVNRKFDASKSSFESALSRLVQVTQQLGAVSDKFSQLSEYPQADRVQETLSATLELLGDVQNTLCTTGRKK